SSRSVFSTFVIVGRLTTMVSSPNFTSALTRSCASLPRMRSARTVRASAIGLAREFRGAQDLLLELEHAVEERLGRGRASGDINVHGHDAIAAAHDAVGIVVIAAAVGAGAHRDDPARLAQLVVDLPQRPPHLLPQR